MLNELSKRFEELLVEVDQVRALVGEKLKADPLPASDKEARVRLEQEIAQYGLEKNIVQLETEGYTIVPPGVAAPLELIERLRTTILRIGEEREREHASFDMGLTIGAGRSYHHLLPEDPVFEEALMSPVMLALVTYLCGYRAKLSTHSGLLKTNETDVDFHFHTDISTTVPPPWPEYSLTANVNWLLTDYTRENGALCVVPGSHLWRKPPPAELQHAHDHPDVKVVEAPAGSMVVWHSGLWHGALRRTAPGMRVLMIMLFARPFYQASGPFWQLTTEEMVARNPARFGVLMGLASLVPWSRSGPNPNILSAQIKNLGKWT